MLLAAVSFEGRVSKFSVFAGDRIIMIPAAAASSFLAAANDELVFVCFDDLGIVVANFRCDNGRTDQWSRLLKEREYCCT